MSKLIISFLAGAILSSTLILLVFKIPPLSNDTAKARHVSVQKQQDTHIDSRPWDAQLSRLEDITNNLGAVVKRLGQPAYISNTTATPEIRATISAGAEPAPSMLHDSKIVFVQPTTEQVDRYTSIKSRLYDAANDYSTDLADLVNKADELTPEQRQELTDEAMEMIRRGELRAEQFIAHPAGS